MYTIGLDFGTLSGRAVLVDARDGNEVAESVFDYPHGVIDDTMPNGLKLPPDWALQHPVDYLDVFAHTVPAVLRESGVDPARVKGIAIDFTASSPMPTTADGTPLCLPARAARRAARLYQIMETSRGAAAGGSDQRDGAPNGRGLAAALRRQDLVGMVLQQIAADSAGEARYLRAHRPLH